MVDNIRVLELIGCVVSATFAVLGVVGLLSLNLNRSVVDLMYGIATDAFLVLFGAAAAIICFSSPPDATSRFGFMATWSGRGIFFLVMGFYLFPATCPGYNEIFDCLRGRELLGQIGVIASMTSVVLGIVILVLRCTRISESYGNVLGSAFLGQAKTMQGLDYACAVASAGMLLLGVMWALQVNLGAKMRDICARLAVIIIVLLFGTSSLLASCRSSAFVSTFFGFLEVIWQRGLFYVLMGFYTFAVSYESHASLWAMICFICSGVSIVAGVIVIVRGC